jgi:hypothetical protein
LTGVPIDYRTPVLPTAAGLAAIGRAPGLTLYP